jgi:hypothetical protein
MTLKARPVGTRGQTSGAPIEKARKVLKKPQPPALRRG